MFKHIYKMMMILAIMTSSYGVVADTNLQDMKGAWLGVMQIPDGPKLRVGVEIFKKADGLWGGNVASLDQGNRYIQVSEVSLNNNIFELQLAGAPISISGKFEQKTLSIDASFKQGKQAFSLLLEKIDNLPEVNRKQTPVETDSYIQKEVQYMNEHDNTWLSGTLTSPKGEELHPAVMLIAGSGPNQRDSYHAGHRPFTVLADRLTRAGYVVLRADKRGVYKSSGNFNAASIEDFALDTQAAVRFLKSHKNVDKNRIILIGHSEGSLVAAMTAELEKVNAIVSMAGPGMSILDILLLQDQTEPAAKGANKQEIDVLLAFSQRFYKTVLNNATEAQRKIKLQKLYDDLQGNEAEIVNKWVDTNNGTLSVSSSSSESFYKFLQLNPLEYWQGFNSPALILNGDNDSQVPAKLNVEGIVNSMKTNQKKVTSKIFPKLNHQFQTADTGATNEYAKIEETINTEVLDTITNWLNANTSIDD